MLPLTGTWSLETKQVKCNMTPSISWLINTLQLDYIKLDILANKMGYDDQISQQCVSKHYQTPEELGECYVVG